MDYVRSIETVVSLYVALFEVQLHSIQLVSRQRVPTALTHQTKTLAEAMLRSIEQIENELVKDVEGESEQIVEHLVGFTKVLTQAKNELPGVEAVENLLRLTKRGQRNTISTLSEKEKEITADITQRFKKMKSKVTSLIARLEAL